MIKKIKENPKKILTIGLVILTLTDISLQIFYGYFSNSTFLLLFILVIPCIRYLILLTLLILIVRLVVKYRTANIMVMIIWLLFALIGQIPKDYFHTLGSLISIYNADTNKILFDARYLLNNYESMSYFGALSRYPLNNPISFTKIPISIQEIHISSVLVLDNYVLIEKRGLEGVFRGFVAFREGFDIWENDNAIVFQNNCITCLKIRIAEGLYWYHADPSAAPLFVTLLPQP